MTLLKTVSFAAGAMMFVMMLFCGVAIRHGYVLLAVLFSTNAIILAFIMLIAAAVADAAK